MRKRSVRLAIFSLVAALYTLQTGELSAQRCFESVEEAMASGERVECLDLSKQRLEYIPSEVYLFKDLKKLNLSRNRLSGDLDSLSVLTNLRYLNIASNYIETLSPKLAVLDLDTLIMWDNPCYGFAKELGAWSLRYLDMRAVQMNRSEQRAIKAMFPKARIRLDHPCNCGSRREGK